jgi:hypothetical protein
LPFDFQNRKERRKTIFEELEKQNFKSLEHLLVLPE